MSTVVQFRMPDEDVRYLEAKGIRANDAARSELEGLIRSMRLKEAFDDPKHPRALRHVDGAAAIREARDDL